jgi:hypothetical protein
MLYPEIFEKHKKLADQYFADPSKLTKHEFDNELMFGENNFVRLKYELLGNFPSSLLPENKKLLDWIINSKYEPHPSAVIASYITILGTLFARYVYTETECSTSMYCVAIAPTASGKDIVTKIPEKVFNHIRDKNREIVKSKVNSVGALDDIFKDHPIVTIIYDEFGDQVGPALKGSSTALADLITKYKNLYSETNGTYEPSRYSSSGRKANIQIPWKQERPCLSITGITTKQQLLDNLDDKFIRDGFINRFMFIDGSEMVPLEDQLAIPKKEVPDDIREHIADIKTKLLEYIKSNNVSFKIIPMRPESLRFFKEGIGTRFKVGSDIYSYCKAGAEETRGALSGRWRENALRLATAISAYEGFEEVSEEVLKWAYTFVKTLGIDFYDKYERDISITRWSGLKDKATDWFHNHGKNGEGFTKTELQQNARPFKGLKKNERNELLEDLETIGTIESYKDGNIVKYRLYKTN